MTPLVDIDMTPEALQIVLWPDPRLRTVAQPVATFDDALRATAARMLELMREHKGVGLAAPQVGLPMRLFVMNATGNPEDDRVYVNPELSDAEGSEEGEEGCLSLPDIRAQIVRDRQIRLRAQDSTGKAFEEVAGGFIARVWQHEIDHLNGTLITDRMGPVAKMTHRKKLKELEAEYTQAHAPARKPKTSMPAFLQK